MSKVECTAVNELVDFARSKPLDSDDGDADLFGGFGNAAPAARLRGTPPPSLFEMPAPPPPPAPVPQPIAQPSPQVRKQLAQHAARAIAIAPLHLGTDDSASTSHVARYVPLSTLGRRFAMPLAGLVGLGIIAGIAYTRLAHHGSTTPAAPAPIVAAAPVAPTVVTPVVTPADTTAPKLVDVRLESTPPGATATLLSNGVSTPLGSTPVDTSIDPTKQYDVVFALAGKPSQVEHFDPSKTQHVEVAFPDAPAAAAVAVADAKPAKASHHSKHARVAAVAAPARSSKSSKSSKNMPSLATPDFGDSPAPTKSSKSSKSSNATDDGGNGSLAITSSAPAAILLDDANTGFMTPHTLSVPAGHHNIRLIAATAHVNKLVQVDVSAHKTTHVNPF
ncbi:MAG TPA: PEGA domain-containing protein [Kofleriaceae bacterium]|jgi:hypothetical protein